jgi:hypothetical protein
MSDPVPAIAEASATGAVAESFTDIRTVLGVEVVNRSGATSRHSGCAALGLENAAAALCRRHDPRRGAGFVYTDRASAPGSERGAT